MSHSATRDGCACSRHRLVCALVQDLLNTRDIGEQGAGPAGDGRPGAGTGSPRRSPPTAPTATWIADLDRTRPRGPAHAPVADPDLLVRASTTASQQRLSRKSDCRVQPRGELALEPPAPVSGGSPQPSGRRCSWRSGPAPGSGSSCATTRPAVRRSTTGRRTTAASGMT